MPSIDVAMARSLHGGAWGMLKDSVVRSVAVNLGRRDIFGDSEDKVTDFKTALSSWDNCMKADFCKWPAIGIMIVGGLIIISILWCIIRCCCCGLSCCCSCFECLKCCGNCCGCCDPPGSRKHKHMDDPYAPPDHANQGYRVESPMAASIPPVATKPYAAPPQYAEFDVPKKGGEDSLPEMPSWEGASSKKIMVEEEVEMDDLKKPVEPPPPVMHAPSGRASPALQGRGPYSQPQGNPSAYFNGGAQPQDTYSPLDQGYGYNSAPSNGYGVNQPYGAMAAGAAVGAAAMGPGRRTPAQPQNGYGRPPMDQGYGQMGTQDDGYGGYDGYARGPTPGPPQGFGVQRSNTGGSSMADSYGMHRTNTGGSNAPIGASAMYATDPRMRQSPGPRQTPAPRRTPAPQGDYSYGQPPRHQSPAPLGDFGYNQPARYQSPAPQADYGYNQPARQSPAPQADYGYGQPPRHQSPAPAPQADSYGYDQPARQTPAPQNDYGYNQAAYNPPAEFGRAYSPAPEGRQLTSRSPAPRPLQPPAARQFVEEPPQSPITNNAGFDFNSGFSRPGTSPPPTQDVYPGYKPYQPS